MREGTPEISKKMVSALNGAKTVVIKVGSSLLIDSENNVIREKWMASLAEQIAKMQEAKQHVVLVSSGAVGVGKQTLGIDFKKPISMEVKQAAASVGNHRLMTIYQQLFAKHNVNVGQILITPGDIYDPRHFHNIRMTMQALLKRGVVPIVNENDTVATYELRFGDNDRLSAQVAKVVSADCLVLLSDIDGLYTADPRKDKKAKFISEVKGVSSDIIKLGGGSGSSVGTGGMRTKLLAAKIATEDAGCHMIISNGKTGNPLANLSNGSQPGTLFVAPWNPLNARILKLLKDVEHDHKRNSITIADNVVSNGNFAGILPEHIIKAEGKADRGEAVAIYVTSYEYAPIAVGVLEHSIDDVNKIKGLKDEKDVAEKLGYPGRYMVIKRENFLIPGLNNNGNGHSKL